MYIRRDCLDAVGYFDEQTLGKGYGEENDWCHVISWVGKIITQRMFYGNQRGVSFKKKGISQGSST